MAKNFIEKIKKWITIQKIKQYLSIDGWLTENEAIGLYRIAQSLGRNAVCVEIGSWQGKSTYCISKGLRDGTVFSIDPFDAGTGASDHENSIVYLKQKGESDLMSIFKSNMAKLGTAGKIVVKRGYSADFHLDFNNIDFLFIDGDHSIEGCKLDFDLYSQKIRQGGFIAFHDYYHNRPELGPTYVINEIISKGNDFIFYRQFDSLWIGRKS